VRTLAQVVGGEGGLMSRACISGPHERTGELSDALSADIGRLWMNVTIPNLDIDALLDSGAGVVTRFRLT
jgi:hypothetical protein